MAMAIDHGSGLAHASGGGVQTDVLAQPTTTEHLLTHMRTNNEQLLSCIADLRASLNRLIGEGPVAAPQPEAATAAQGILGCSDEVLNEQSHLLNDLRECVLVIEKIA